MDAENARYSYQVALVAGNGYSVQAQNFAATHRIPLIEFTRMPFWTELEQLLHNEATTEEDICKFAHEVGRKLALAVTNSGQLLYLYRISEMGLDFEHSEYTLHWKSEDSLWELSNRHTTGDICYLFQLPEQLAERMKSHAETFRELQRDAIDMKAEYFSQMAVYYRENGHARIGNIRINKQWLEEAKAKLR